MMNKKKMLVTGVSVFTGLFILLGVSKIAESSSDRNNAALQIDKKTVTSISTTTTVIETTEKTATPETTEETTTTTPETASEETTTVTTTLPKEIIPEVTTTTTSSETTTTTSSETTTTTTTNTTTEIPTTTTAIDPENIEGITHLSYEDVKAFVISNFDDYPENYTIYINNGVYYLNEYVIVFTNMENIGDYKETSIGMGIVVSTWAQPGYVIVMADKVG